MSDPRTSTHRLKFWRGQFMDVWLGRKTFELWRNDRDFRLGDAVVLEEVEAGAGGETVATGRTIKAGRGAAVGERRPRAVSRRDPRVRGTRARLVHPRAAGPSERRGMTHPTATCSSCGAAMIWAITKTGARSPYDATPDPQGAYSLAVSAADGLLHATFVPKGHRGAGLFATELYTSHFATCPTAEKHRRPSP